MFVILDEAHLIDVDALTVAGTGVPAAFCMRFQRAGQWITLTSLGFIGAAGISAMISPRLFSRLARSSSLWVDIDGLVEKIKRRIDIDCYVLRYCRFFGTAVPVAVVVLATLLISRT